MGQVRFHFLVNYDFLLSPARRMDFITQTESWLKNQKRAKGSANPAPPTIADDVTMVQDDLTKAVGAGFLLGSTVGLHPVPRS